MSFVFSCSWGCEQRINDRQHRHTLEPEENAIPENLLRLSVGIEHIDDLLGDLEQALG